MNYGDYGKIKLVSVRPLSRSPEKVRNLIRAKGDTLKLEALVLVDRLSGYGPRVLVHSTKEEKIREALKDCKTLRIPFAVFSADEVMRGPTPERVKRIIVGEDKISFEGTGTNTFSADREETVFIVMTSKNQKRLSAKRRSALLLKKEPSIPFEEAYRLFLTDGAYLDMYFPERKIYLRIDTRKFDYSSLGEKMTPSVLRNSDILIRELTLSFRLALVDFSFGEGFFPFVSEVGDLEGEKLEDALSRYSRFVFRSLEKGLYGSLDALAEKTSVRVEGTVAGVLLSPLDEDDRGGGVEEKAKSEGTAGDSVLPPPPVSPVRVSGGGFYFLHNLRIFLSGFFERWKNLLKPASYYSTTGVISLGSIMIAWFGGKQVFLIPGLLFGGAFFFGASFLFLSLKRKIENLPTGKVRSAPMGVVELKGRARCKYYVKAPFSGVECVYYKYIVLETKRVGRRTITRVREWGESGRVPFYLEDDTGRILVNPDGAVFEGGRIQIFHGGEHLKMSPGGEPLGFNAEVIETVYPDGGKLYVLGYAQPARSSVEERKMRIMQRLMEIKRSSDEMKKYDQDGDGTVDSYEWDKVREKVELEIMMSEDGDGEDRVVIGRPPGSGIFLISDRKEKNLSAWMGARAFVFFALSLACVVVGFILLFSISG